MHPYEALTAEAILHNLGTDGLPRQVLVYPQVTSTMDVIRAALQQDADYAFPLLVLAEAQTAGRGRMGRPWTAPPGSSLLFSLALHPRWLAPVDLTALIWMAGVSLCEGIAAVTQLQPCLKWPNDVLLPTRSGLHKLAGILLESSSSSTQVNWAIIGCGLNVYASPPASTLLRYPATHLAAALHEPVSRLSVLRAILVRLDYWYSRLQAGARTELFTVWRDLLVTVGQEVHIQTDSGTLSGLAEEVDSSGALHVRDAAGILHVVTNGDVSD